MLKVEITSDSRYPVNRKVVKMAIAGTFAKNKIVNPSVEVSVLVAGSRKMDELLKKYMDDGEKHSVLAFALEELDGKKGSFGFVNPNNEPLALGDIVLCWPEVLAEASQDDMLVDDKLAFLCAHATEHLLGQHHE